MNLEPLQARNIAHCANRTTFLDHVWTFNVGAGDSVTFYVEAARTDSGEGDEFTD